MPEGGAVLDTASARERINEQWMLDEIGEPIRCGMCKQRIAADYRALLDDDGELCHDDCLPWYGEGE
jgi:hypothetical protein